MVHQRLTAVDTKGPRIKKSPPAMSAFSVDTASAVGSSMSGERHPMAIAMMLSERTRFNMMRDCIVVACRAREKSVRQGPAPVRRSVVVSYDRTFGGTTVLALP
jgi:uncharacterized protein with beta-barrel porin domain